MHKHKKAVLKHGEKFSREDSSLPELIGSIINSTSATFSLAVRASFFQGLMTIGCNTGEYLKRELDGSSLMVATVHPQQRSLGLDMVYLTKCNQVVTLARPKRKAVTATDGANEYDVYAHKILAFVDVTNRSFKEQKDGLKDNEITVMHIPTRMGIKRMDRVYFHKDSRKDEGLDDLPFYRVDSINEALSYPSPLGDREYGLEIVQLADDLRIGEPKPNSSGKDPADEKHEWWE